MLISIITINYNNKSGLEKTIKSVISQSYKNIQYIVIDGGSVDGSIEVINNYKNKIEYSVSEPDNGIYHAMNKGLDRATGDYLLFLNSGDCLTSVNIIAEIADKLNTNEDIIFGLTKSVPSCTINYTDVHLPFTLIDFYKYSPVPHPASFIKREIMERFRYDESLRIVSDWKFFMQAIIFNGCSYKKIETVITDFEEGGLSHVSNEEGEKERIKVLKELLPKYIYDDYFKFSYGDYDYNSKYDMFFLKIKNYRYGKLIYSMSVLFIRLVAVIRPYLRFSRNYPLRLK